MLLLDVANEKPPMEALQKSVEAPTRTHALTFEPSYDASQSANRARPRLPAFVPEGPRETLPLSSIPVHPPLRTDTSTGPAVRNSGHVSRRRRSSIFTGRAPASSTCLPACLPPLSRSFPPHKNKARMKLGGYVKATEARSSTATPRSTNESDVKAFIFANEFNRSFQLLDKPLASPNFRIDTRR